MDENGRTYVNYPVLWAVATAVLAATFIGISTMFAWHKEIPHTGSLTVTSFVNRVEVISLRLDQIEDDIRHLHRGE